MNSFFSGKTVMITGGTGSFGKMFVKTILRDCPDVKKIIIYSRGELKQFNMKQMYPQDKYPQLRFFIGDVRDGERLTRACQGVDIIIHTAAIKQVDTAEYNPDECIKTNINGAQNVINAALANNVKDIVALSTDKACAPINLYGATKLTSDKLFVAANNIRGSKDMRFSVVRYGNVMGSRGSVIPFFIDKRNSGAEFLPITDMRMTRFNISLEAGVELVMYALSHHMGGEIFIPKIPSYKICDVATAIAPNLKQVEVGIRPGEKLHEEMITATDSLDTIDLGKYYAILPSVSFMYNREDYLKHHNAHYVEQGFHYSSDNNTEWETVESMRENIKKYVDPNFEVK
ncbi:MAG: UDP-N-acetylglucosamine 4,6-dehydratase (inverting) [Bacteroidaceae bacterium]|nr:UDP-N-acetylglucosamine 4,6-dehydratase (inverting) [Bacteroidaceae bacterium]